MNSIIGDTLPQIVLIVEKDVLVAQDLAETIGEVWAGVQFAVVQSVDHAQAAISGRGRVAMVFFHGDPTRMHGSELEEILKTHRARVVLTGDWDAARARQYGWEALPSPFSAQEVHALLQMPDRTRFASATALNPPV